LPVVAPVVALAQQSLVEFGGECVKVRCSLGGAADTIACEAEPIYAVGHALIV
jgi:hypothetical protein